MFEFTREFILNDIKDVKMSTDGAVLMVPKMINIEKSKVQKIYHMPYESDVEESLVLPCANLKGALTITIGQEGRVISLVSSRDAENQKDYIFNGTPADWKRQFERQAAMEDMDRLIDVTFDASNNMTIQALDCYTRVLSVAFDGVTVSSTTETPTTKAWTRKAYFQNSANRTLAAPTWVGTSPYFTPGDEGHGTVARLQKNNRVLTAANITPYGFDRDERPRPGFQYDQYTIQYVSERRHQTAGVFGAIDHSLVTLIFFVPATLKNVDGDTFDDLVKNLGAIADVKDAAIDAKEEVVAKTKATKANAKGVTDNATAIAANAAAIEELKNA
jgi:hypothetical protein